MGSQVFEVRGIPTLILLTPDGQVITADGRNAIEYGASYFPWGPDDMARGKAEAERIALEKKQKAIEAEQTALKDQIAKGGPVIKRLRGEPGTTWSHSLADHQVELKNF